MAVTHIVTLLDAEFWPKWFHALYQWLQSNPDFEEVSHVERYIFEKYEFLSVVLFTFNIIVAVQQCRLPSGMLGGNLFFRRGCKLISVSKHNFRVDLIC